MRMEPTKASEKAQWNTAPAKLKEAIVELLECASSLDQAFSTCRRCHCSSSPCEMGVREAIERSHSSPCDHPKFTTEEEMLGVFCGELELGDRFLTSM